MLVSLSAGVAGVKKEAYNKGSTAYTPQITLCSFHIHSDWRYKCRVRL